MYSLFFTQRSYTIHVSNAWAARRDILLTTHFSKWQSQNALQQTLWTEQNVRLQKSLNHTFTLDHKITFSTVGWIVMTCLRMVVIGLKMWIFSWLMMCLNCYGNTLDQDLTSCLMNVHMSKTSWNNGFSFSFLLVYLHDTYTARVCVLLKLEK